jgi:hypothetical protein
VFALIWVLVFEELKCILYLVCILIWNEL